MAAAAYTVDDLRAAIREHGARLLGLPHVLYLGIGERRRSGAGTGRLAVRVYVRRKQPVAARDRVPSHFSLHRGDRRIRVPTDVEERPEELAALALKGGDRIHGAAVGAVAFAYRTPTRRSVFLTCAHVAAGLNGHHGGRPVRDARGRRLGRVRRTTPIYTDRRAVHRLDATLVEAEEAIDPLALGGHGILDGSGLLRVGSNAPHLYIGSGGARRVLTGVEEIASPRIVRIGRSRVRFDDFLELRQVGGAAPRHGDSGSLLFRADRRGRRACGLVFAGRGTTVAVLRFTDVVHALGEAWTSPAGIREDVRVDWQSR